MRPFLPPISLHAATPLTVAPSCTGQGFSEGRWPGLSSRCPSTHTCMKGLQFLGRWECSGVSPRATSSASRTRERRTRRTKELRRLPTPSTRCRQSCSPPITQDVHFEAHGECGVGHPGLSRTQVSLRTSKAKRPEPVRRLSSSRLSRHYAIDNSIATIWATMPPLSYQPASRHRKKE